MAFAALQPSSHSSDSDSIQVYKVEPYVMVADIYGTALYKGRGGWTWYTGSAGWMYQFIIGSLLGMELQKDVLTLKPCFPMDWPSVSMIYSYGSSTFRITIFQLNNNEESWWIQDETYGKGNTIQLIDDGKEHKVEVYICTRFPED